MSVNSGTHLATSMWLMFTALKDTLERGLFLLTGISPKLIGQAVEIYILEDLSYVTGFLVL